MKRYLKGAKILIINFRVGYTEHDFKQVLKIAVQISLEKEKKMNYMRLEDKKYVKLMKEKIIDYYEITNDSIK